MTSLIDPRCGRILMLLAALTQALPGAADPLRDPTEPPAAWRPASAAAARPEAPPRPPPSLQAVWRRHGAEVAVIDGVRVAAGDRVRDSRVMAIGTDHVRLREASGRVTTLSLTPRVRSRATPAIASSAGMVANEASQVISIRRPASLPIVTDGL